MKFEIIPTKAILYDKCENVEQLYDNFYYPLLVEYKELKEKEAILGGIQQLEAEIERLKKENSRLRKKIKELKEEMK